LVAEEIRSVLVDVHFLDHCNDLTAGVVTAGPAHVVGAAQLAAVRALIEGARDQRIMRTTHVAFGRADLMFGDRHDLDLFSRTPTGGLVMF
jgi:hypothetical protein